MALSQRLDFRQVQSLVMTPQLQQAIKLLQLSNIELADFVEEQIEQNPLLEKAAPDDAPEPVEATDAADVDIDIERLTPDDFTGDVDNTDTFADAPVSDAADSLANDADIHAKTDDTDGDYENSWEQLSPSEGPGASSQSGSGGSFGDNEDFDLIANAADKPSLRDNLDLQVDIEFSDVVDRLIGKSLIDALDESGYLAVSPPEIALSLGIGVDRVEAVRARMRLFEPAGLFSTTLAECLAAQLQDLNRLDPAMQALLDNLELLARREFDRLRKICEVDVDDLADMVQEIRALDPRPASTYLTEPASAIVPDILMRPDPAGGGWLIELNTDALPRVLVDGTYHASVRKAARTKEDRAFIAEQYNAANWLIKALHQRATTILRVSTEIVRRQDSFFDQGVTGLTPLTLKDVAEELDMHESTISRVTSNKYMATPRGLFELKYFFTASIAGTNGASAHSAEAVRFRIRKLIDTEGANAILSDDKIVEILRGQGVDIARRTVAKYRESMRIPSSVQRRREKAAAL